jgi:heme/copper-type cytochrome/quinol oxidase subunit 2
MDLLEEGIIAEEHELKIDGEISGYLLEAGRWSKFIAITFYILLGIAIAAILLLKGDIIGGYYRDQHFTRLLIILGVSTVIIVTTLYFLIDFANKVKAGIETENIETVNKGLHSLKTYFIIIGILMMLQLAYDFYKMIDK